LTGLIKQAKLDTLGMYGSIVVSGKPGS